MLTDEDSKRRLTFLMLTGISFAGCLLCRAAYIQLFSQHKLEKMARRQYQSHVLVRPRRGSIVDRNGEPLAINRETFSLAANPSRIHKKRQMARLLARTSVLPYTKLLQKLQEDKEFIWIKRHLSDEELKRFKKTRIVDSDGEWMDGLWVVKESERVYPHGHLASHILGDVNVDSEGLEGIELWKNDQLRGNVVSVRAMKDALGRPTFIDAEAAQTVQDGQSLQLTLDSSLQFEVEQELQAAVKRTGSRAGSVIVMDATNGEILALANAPSFDPGEKGVPADRRRNRALTDGYEPGSTLKSMLIATALSQGWKISDRVWGERGSFVIQGHKISEAEAHEKFEWLSLKEVLQYSSNVGAAKIALRLGADRYSKALAAFGFGAKTGLGFPGEISGRIPPRKEWSLLSLANIGFGQGILATPIQMTRAYAAILNGGFLIQPTLFRNTGQKVAPLRIFSKQVSQDLIDSLESVVEKGTGTKAAVPGYLVAGKTGTAQMVDSATGRYSKERYVASFIGFPVGVEPKVVIFTSLSEPKGVYFASQTAAPLFKEVLASVANRCGLPIRVSSPVLASTDQVKLSQAAPLPVVDNSKDPNLMPSLKGLSPREVFPLFRGRNFRIEVEGVGVVSSQVPAAGKSLAEGDVIRLILSEP